MLDLSPQSMEGFLVDLLLAERLLDAQHEGASVAGPDVPGGAGESPRPAPPPPAFGSIPEGLQGLVDGE